MFPPKKGKLPKARKGKMITEGPIHAHRLTERGSPGHDPSHAPHNRAAGLPPDMYGQGGQGYMEGPGDGNCEMC